MDATAPVAIGTRGTVGSLLNKEIEYFTKFELEGRGSLWTSQGQIVEMNCRNDHSRPSSFWLLMSGWKKKNRRGCTGFLPSMCSGSSATEVADMNQLKKMPGFSYRILKN